MGAISGNNNLMKYGGILSLAGGVAGMATGAWSTTAIDLAGEAAREGSAMFGNNPSAYIGGIGGANAGAAAVAANPSMLSVGGIGAEGAMPAMPAVAPAQSFNTAPAIAANGPGAMPPGGGDAAPSRMLDGLKSAMSWAKDNKELTQAGAGLLQAGMSAYGQQEAIKEQLLAREQVQQRARDRLNASVQGLKMPVYQRG